MRSEAGAGGRGWMRARATGRVQLQLELQLPCCLGTGVQDQLGRHEYTAHRRGPWIAILYCPYMGTRLPLATLAGPISAILR